VAFVEHCAFLEAWGVATIVSPATYNILVWQAVGTRPTAPTDAGDSPMKRSSQTSQTSSRRLKIGDIIEPEEGTIVGLRTLKILWRIFAFAAGALISILGMLMAIGGFLAGLGFFATKDNRTGLLIGMPLVFLFFVALFLLFAVLCYSFGSSYFRRERFVLGKTYLQEIIGAGQLQRQVPFDDITEIVIGTKTEENQTYQYIGIDVANLDRKDALIPKPILKHNHDNFGCDVVIFDDYDMPLKDFCKKLKRCWRKAIDRKVAAASDAADD
jgi:hypothetical protein